MDRSDPSGRTATAGIAALHALFFGTFAVRLVVDRLQPARPRVAPPAARPAQAARLGDAFIALHGLGFALQWLGAFAPRERWSRRTPLLPPQPAPAATLGLLAVALAAWTVTSFRSWRVRAIVAPEHELATSGPFALVRHPVYLTADLLAIATGLWRPAPLVLLGAAVIAVAGDLRARAEERLLVAAFGERYRAYQRRVRRFLPYLY